ncbi:hypothetical protein TNCV_1431011 [Trichonephila clavipes]|nr:hypothetical protein TNCV_1431011 [Trichonephila clavipes]
MFPGLGEKDPDRKMGKLTNRRIIDVAIQPEVRFIAETKLLEKVIEKWTSRLDYIRASHGSHMPEIIFKM